MAASAIGNHLPPVRMAVGISVLLACMLGAALAHVLKPARSGVSDVVELDAGLPRQFAGWQDVPSVHVQAALTAEDRSSAVAATYDQAVMRTYKDGAGHGVMLALAYIEQNRQEAKIHRPELCYAAQGFRVLKIEPHEFNLRSFGKPVLGKRMEVVNGSRLELVSYWIRIGHLYSENAVQTRLHILSEGVQGRIPDGILVRASQVVSPTISSAEKEAAFLRQERFLTALVEAAPRGVKNMLMR